MPFVCSEYQKRYSWQEADGVPVADVILLGNMPYVACCPLCGGLHELPTGSARNGIVTAPRCLIREFAQQRRSIGQAVAWDVRYGEWLAKHPEAAQHTEIRVKLVSIAELMERPAPKVVRKKRSTASPKVPPVGKAIAA